MVGGGRTLELRGVDPMVGLVLGWKQVAGMVGVGRGGGYGGRS